MDIRQNIYWLFTISDKNKTRGKTYGKWDCPWTEISIKRKIIFNHALNYLSFYHLSWIPIFYEPFFYPTMGFEKYFLRSMINFLLTRTNNTKCRRKIQSHFIKKNLIFSLNLVSYVGMDGSLKGGGGPCRLRSDYYIPFSQDGMGNHQTYEFIAP